jgi:hypothetical protein
MNTLISLQESGALPTSLKVVDNKEVIPLSKKEEDMTVHGAVVIDNPIWIATADGKSVKDAARVYSSDGEMVCLWDREKNTLSKMILQGTETGTVLATTKILKFHEEEQQMADLDLDKALAGLDMGDLNAEIEKVAGSTGKGTEAEKAKGFDVDNDEGAKEKSEKDIEKEQKIAFYNNIREKIDKSVEGSVNAPAEVTRNNFIYGRLISFITPSDDTIRLSVVSTNKLDENNKPILDPTVTDQAVIDKYNSGEGRVASKYLLKEAAFSFKNTKPGKAKGIIFTIPAGTDLPLTSIGRASADKYDLEDKTLVTHVLDYNAALLYLAYNFADHIRESEELLGNGAGTLTVVHSFSTNKEGATLHRDAIKPEKRKSLLVPGNYFPLKTFDTISTQDLTEENKGILNLNVEKAYVSYLNRTPEKKAPMSDTEKAKFTMNGDSIASSCWFNEGAPIDINNFYDGEKVTNVRIPVVKKEPNTKTGGYKYSFAYNKLSDPQGPMNDPRFEAIVKASGLGADMFAKAVSAISGAKKGGKSSGVNTTMSSETYLKAYAARELDFEDSRSLADVQSLVDTMNAEIA